MTYVEDTEYICGVVLPFTGEVAEANTFNEIDAEIDADIKLEINQANEPVAYGSWDITAHTNNYKPILVIRYRAFKMNNYAKISEFALGKLPTPAEIAMIEGKSLLIEFKNTKNADDEEYNEDFPLGELGGNYFYVDSLPELRVQIVSIKY